MAKNSRVDTTQRRHAKMVKDGCPVTFIPDFVRNLYVPVADAAVTKGILSVSD